jgi:hypothetical protein
MSSTRLGIFSALLLAACPKGARVPACAAGETNRCSCASGGEGLQACLPSGEAFGACVCSSACANGAACVSMPGLVSKDLDSAGALLDQAGLLLPDPVDPKGFITVQQVADPPVQVLAQDPPAGTPVKPGTRVALTVTLPPDQETLGLPNANFLVGHLTQDTTQSAQSYYDTLDPGPFPTRATLADWKTANGFGTPADAEASALYVTHTDLGFGRHMHMRRKGRRVAFYVDNYPSVEDAIAGTRFFATVAMEWSPGPHGKDTDPYFTQFYAFNKKGDRISDPILDDHGPKQMPAVCLVCHGGYTSDLTYQSNGGNLGAHFIPFDVDAEQFLARPGYTRADQEWAFKAFNEAVQATWDPADPSYPAGDPPPALELIDGWYGGPGHPSATFQSGATPAAWDVSPSSHALYHQVFARSCQTCHAQREASRNFSTYAKFAAVKPLIRQRVFDEGAMPLSQRGFLNFWLSYPEQPKILATWLGAQLRGPGRPIACQPTVQHSGPFLTGGLQVVLDATCSQYATNFAWRQLSGPPVQLSAAAPDQSKVTFTAPAGPVTLSFQLVVSLSGLGSDTTIVSVPIQGLPTKPLAVTAAAGANSATITWTAPASDGNSPIQHSTVVVNPGGATSQVTGAGTQTTVTGLSAGATYSFTVVATNELGDSPPSDPSNAVTVFTTPGAPTNVVASRGNAQVSLTWTAPTNTGGVPLTGYDITGKPGPATAIHVPASPTSTAITGLSNGTSYVFTVAADNGAQGPGALSNAVTPATIPGAPTAPSAAPGNASATVTWSAPTSNGGDGITSYTVAASPGPVTTTVSGSTFAAVVNGLTNGQTYTFTITATNGVGTGPGSITNAIVPSTTPGVPSAPQNVTATFPNISQTATVSWSAPAVTGNSALTGYQITGSPAPSAPIMVGPTVTSTNISGLTGGVSYTFTVAATNSQGTGGGATSAAVLIQGPPQAPSLNSLMPGYVSGTVGTLTPAWTAPSNTGGSAITGYTISTSPAITPVNVGPTITSRTLTGADGLARCTTYAVTVTAQNTWGTGPASNSLAALDGTVPATMPAPSASPGAAQINLSWSPPSDGGCNIDQYSFTSNPAGLGSTTTSTMVSISQTACNYIVSGSTCSGSQSCSGVATSCESCNRSWTFQVSAHNVAGLGTVSPSTAPVTPLVSYSLDHLDCIWSFKPCQSCHSGAQKPVLSAALTASQRMANATAEGAHIYMFPSGSDSDTTPPAGGICSFYALASPCWATMCSGSTCFSTSSAEYNTLLRWVQGGNQP